MRAVFLIVLVLGLLVMPGCMMNERLSGTVLGGVGGGVIGAATGGVGGAVIGLLAGGLAGYLVGDYIADRRERGRSSVYGNGCCPQPDPCAPPCATPQSYQPQSYGPQSYAPQSYAPQGAYPPQATQPAGWGAPGAVAGVKMRAPAVVNGRTTDPAGAKAAYDRGKAALTAPEARVHFEQSIRLDPTRPEPYNALALNALYRGDHSEAERLWQRALSIDPAYGPAKYNFERYQRQHGAR